MTNRNMKIYSIMGLVAVAGAMLPEVAFADGAGVGDSLFSDVQGLVQGNIGVIIGLLLSLFGLWMWLVQQATWGLLIVIGGAALTAFPGIYSALNQGVKNAFTDINTSASEANRADGSSVGD